MPRDISTFTLQCSSVAQLCPTVCDPMDCSTLGFPGHQSLELAQTHIHQVSDGIPPSHPSSSSSPPAFNFPASGSFPMSQFFASGGQSIVASESVFPVNIQGWFSLRLTGLISLLSKGLSRVFSSTIIWKYQFLGGSLLCGPALTSVHDY